MDERLFRDAMGKFATGITVVSIKDNDRYTGMTVNAFMSISLNPKLIAISIDERAGMYDKLKSSKKFGVSVLKEDQKDLSKIFARQKEQDQEIAFIEQDGVPVIKNSLATISCETEQQIKAGDHLIFIAKVTDINIQDGEPILYFGGNYRTVNPHKL
ncbi:flavin reductase family protein [Pseudogracilibacillus sp. SE30717A]|uniref:flavin reductase family protein n=1 Tax=Pseudogracilibacillus sp. SE30717A TaxID=3098293 RepID=UPI00300E66A9